jgi:aldehyde:ferredoxin oxidoreductase
MPQGYWGEILEVDLTSGSIQREAIPDGHYRRYLGGYGLGARLLIDRLRPGDDPLGPGNILGIFPGTLTGSGAPFSGRFMVVGRSPLTGGWGDSNCGGSFGPVLRGTGLDGILIRGRAPRPVLLEVWEGDARIRDAGDLWGLEGPPAEEAIRRRMGGRARALCIGTAGERRSLLAGIVHDSGRIAARCGLGAVMGAKNLKAIAVSGARPLPISAPADFKASAGAYLSLFRRRPSALASRMPRLLITLLPLLRRLGIRPSSGPADLVVDSFRRYGTTAGTTMLIELGDTPVRNWEGIGYRDFPLDRGERLGAEAIRRNVLRPYACASCPVACGGRERTPDGEKELRLEYETVAAFGPLLLLDDLEAVRECNHICNSAGLDSISTGGAVAFALECAAKDWLPEELKAELPLRWGDAPAVIELVRRIARREPGLGEWLADGVSRAAARLTPEATHAAIHAGGQELPMHRGIYQPVVAAGYALDPAPGRHTSTLSGTADLPAMRPYFELMGRKPAGRDGPAGQGKTAAITSAFARAFDSLGLCHFALQMGEPPFLDWLNAATGWEMDEAELFDAGWRIQILRHEFNAREGLPPARELPARERGDPPQAIGPTKGITLDLASMAQGYFDLLGLDPSTGHPLPQTVDRLGLQAELAPPA